MAAHAASPTTRRLLCVNRCFSLPCAGSCQPVAVVCSVRDRPMRLRVGASAFVLLAVLGVLQAFQRPFRESPGIEYNDFPLPSDWGEKTEFAFARLMYPPSPYARGGYGFRGKRNMGWRPGNSIWTQGYPPADPHFLHARRLLTPIHTPSGAQPGTRDDRRDAF